MENKKIFILSISPFDDKNKNTNIYEIALRYNFKIIDKDEKMPVVITTLEEIEKFKNEYSFIQVFDQINYSIP